MPDDRRAEHRPMRLFLRCVVCAEIRLMDDPGDTTDPVCDGCATAVAPTRIDLSATAVSDDATSRTTPRVGPER